MSQDTDNVDRRNHPRFPIRAHAEIAYSTRIWEVHILDMSMTGAKLALISEHLLRSGDHIKLTISSEEIGLQEVKKSHLQLNGHIVHIRDHFLGIEYQPATEMDKQLLVLLLAQTEE